LLSRRVADLDHLAVAVRAAVLADTMRLPQLAALRACDKRRRLKPLMPAAIATAVAGYFCFWYSTHALFSLHLCTIKP
jgi:hypothetical protein